MLKSEKGAVTMVIVVSIVFLMTFGMIMYANSIRDYNIQTKTIKEIQKAYYPDNINLENLYYNQGDYTPPTNGYLTTSQLQYLGNQLANDIKPEIEVDVDNIIDNRIKEMYPIGSIYVTTNSESPGKYLGGTWVRYGNGKTMVGIDENDTDFDSIEDTGGSKTHTHSVTATGTIGSTALTVSQIPSHSHIMWGYIYGSGRKTLVPNKYYAFNYDIGTVIKWNGPLGTEIQNSDAVAIGDTEATRWW